MFTAVTVFWLNSWFGIARRVVFDLVIVQSAHGHVSNTDHVVVVPHAVLIVLTLLYLRLDVLVFLHVVLFIVENILALTKGRSSDVRFG